MFRSFYIFLGKSVITYAEVTKIDKMGTFIQVIVTENQ